MFSNAIFEFRLVSMLRYYTMAVTLLNITYCSNKSCKNKNIYLQCAAMP